MKNLKLTLSILLILSITACVEEVEPNQNESEAGEEASGGLWENLNSTSGAYVEMSDFVDMTVTTTDVKLSTGEIGGMDYTDISIRPETNAYLLKIRFFEVTDGGDHNYPSKGSYQFDFAKFESFNQQLIVADISWFEPNYGFRFAVNEFTEATFNLEYINGENIDVSFDIIFNSDDNTETINTKGVVRVR